ncbi:MAG TPA: nuclear transport factor 2 family protein, partial [Nitrososphaerales archaeon]|nr:nuclear transport factor 2 family protein [Nitrososphaerales archaeon]
MHPTPRRTGVSRLAVAAAAAAVAVIVIGGYTFVARGPATSTQTSAAGPPTVPVQTTVTQFVQDLNDRNVDGLVTLYSPNAVDIWFGNTGGLSGQYVGPEQIRLIYATSVGKTTTLDANLSDYAQDAVSPTNA